MQCAFGGDRHAGGDDVDLAGLERRDETIDVVGQELRLDAHVGRELARDVDLEADELSVGAARGPRREQRYTDAQRAGVQHVLQIARCGFAAERERQYRQNDRRSIAPCYVLPLPPT